MSRTMGQGSQGSEEHVVFYFVLQKQKRSCVNRCTVGISDFTVHSFRAICCTGKVYE